MSNLLRTLLAGNSAGVTTQMTYDNAAHGLETFSVNLAHSFAKSHIVS